MTAKLAPPQPPAPTAVEVVDAAFLETLVGYNARRTALAVIEVFLQEMAQYDFRPVDFSVASLIAHNPGITSRQLCAALGMQPPNLVALIKQFEQRGLIARQPHATDRRATGLHATPKGLELIRRAESTAQALELRVASALTDSQRKTLITLLQKVYKKA